MDNIESLTRKETPDIGFTGFSSFNGKKKTNLEEAFLSVGAAVSIAALQLLCLSYEGLTSIYLGFAGMQVAGVCIGLALRNRTKIDTLSCISTKAEEDVKPKQNHRILIKKTA